jgi:hypothetical protein
VFEFDSETAKPQLDMDWVQAISTIELVVQDYIYQHPTAEQHISAAWATVLKGV